MGKNYTKDTKQRTVKVNKGGKTTMGKVLKSIGAAILMITACLCITKNVQAATSEAWGENIAYHKAVEVSSTEAWEYSGDKAVDADGTTRWSSAYADEQYIIVDLGEARHLKGVKLAWEAAYASQYQIQTSNNYDDWTTVYSDYNAVGGNQRIEFDATARYVKVYCIRRATQYGFSLYEFEIYASDGNEGTTEGNGNVNQNFDIVDAPGEITEVKIVDANAVDAAKSLFVYLKEVGQEYLLFGHQNDNSEGIVNKDGIISDTYHTVGAYPAITGFEMANVVNSFDYHVSLVKLAYKNNSIPTLCDHMPNFSSWQTGYTSGDMTPTYDKIMPGGADHWKFKERLDRTAEFALSCVDENGELIPIIYRPFHENSGNWFWWGTNLTKEQFVNLWRFTVEYLRDEKGVHNLLYAYSPNGHFASEADYLSRYPGDEYVDIIGFDIYHDYPSYSDQWMQQTLKDAQIAVSVANEKGKVAALTEVGMRYNGSDGLSVYNNTMKDWYTRLYDTLMNDETAKQIAYMMTWRNQDKTHFWVPYDNGYGDRHEMADNFTAFYKKSNVIFADRLGNFAELRNINTITHENSATAPGGENMAYHKAVEVSSVEAAEYSGSKAVDADGTTRWSSAFADNQYIIVDLGEAKAIKGVKLAWEAAYASQYQIQVSNNYDDWDTVYSDYNFGGGTQYIGLDATARYVKVYCIRRATEYGFSLYEFEIY